MSKSITAWSGRKICRDLRTTSGFLLFINTEGLQWATRRVDESLKDVSITQCDQEPVYIHINIYIYIGICTTYIEQIHIVKCHTYLYCMSSMNTNYFIYVLTLRTLSILLLPREEHGAACLSALVEPKSLAKLNARKESGWVLGSIASKKGVFFWVNGA